MGGGRSSAVVVSLLIGPVHTAFGACLQAPAFLAEEGVEGPQPVEFQVQRLVVVYMQAVMRVQTKQPIAMWLSPVVSI